MKRISLYLTIALITFALGISAAIVWLSQDTVDVPSPFGNVVDVDYYQLALEPEKYVGKDIRLRVMMDVHWKGSLMKSVNEPGSWPKPVFFGVDYAPESERSFTEAEGILGVDPEDPKGEINSVRYTGVILVGRFVSDMEKRDFIGRTYPYWFIVKRLEHVERKSK